MRLTIALCTAALFALPMSPMWAEAASPEAAAAVPAPHITVTTVQSRTLRA
jgi:hypothetical protein